MAARDIILTAVVVFVFGVAFLASHFAMNQAFDQLKNNTVVNESQPAITALEAAQNLTSRMDYIVFTIFIILCLALIITGWFIGGHPIFMFIYFVIIVIGTILGAVLANAWETISSNAVLLSSVTSFPLTNHILSALPIYTAVVGFIGIVVMFAKPFMVSQE